MKRNNYHNSDESESNYRDNRQKLTVYHCQLCNGYFDENWTPLKARAIDETEYNITFEEIICDDCKEPDEYKPNILIRFFAGCYVSYLETCLFFADIVRKFARLIKNVCQYYKGIKTLKNALK